MEAERGAGFVENYDGSVCSQSWYRLMTHFGRLYEGSVVCNTALMGACSYGQRVDCAGQVTGRALGDGGRGVSCLLESWG